MKINHSIKFFGFVLSVLIICGCNPSNKKTDNQEKIDTAAQSKIISADTTAVHDTTNKAIAEQKKELPQVFVYNFHVTNRCSSCIAIEEATTKTLNTYFSAEVKQGRIKRQILNVDDDFNKAISEKYQVFGSALIVSRIFNKKETTTDLTGDGFKFAKNKEEKFIEILKNKITEYLK
jgi:hypothetical protein